MTNVKLTTQEYWQSNRESVVFKRQGVGHGIDEFIKQYIPITTNGSVIEIGSFPGPHLATFGDLGYELNGIDFCTDNATGLPQWLQREGFKTGDFWVSDFFEFTTPRQFDVVCSFGFIEHFLNYDEVIAKHAALVKKGGYLMITTPNFRGSVQHFLHKKFDKENLAVHNVHSMYPEKWAKQLEQMGFEIKYKGYFGGFWFWRGAEQLSPVKTKLLWLTERIIPRLRKLIWFESAACSAYCGIVAKKV
jgi:2-polyprenyl-3-methyl-5-hydroxy-6-metoxy-1,4-benzoquinol methylase